MDSARRALTAAEKKLEENLSKVPEGMRDYARGLLKQQMAALSQFDTANTGSSPGPSSAEALSTPQSGTDAGNALAKFLQDLVTEARTDPAAPSTFPILMLDELARRQGVELSKPFAPQALRWGLLEFELFTAIFARYAEAKPQPATSLREQGIFRPASWQGPQQPGQGAKKTPTISQGGDPADELCSSGADAWVVKEGLKLVLDKDVRTTFRAARALNQIWGLVQFYANNQVQVFAQTEPSVHKPIEGEGAKQARFVARAGVDDATWREYESVMRDDMFAGGMSAVRGCARRLGLPVIEDLGDLGAEVKNWSIDWDIDVVPQGIATWSLTENEIALKGTTVMRLRPEGTHSATARFVLDITPESKDLHSDPNAAVKTGHIIATAKIMSAKPPSASILVGFGKGLVTLNVVEVVKTLGEAMVDLGTGLSRELAMPKATAVVEVTFHEGDGYLIDVMRDGTRIYGTKCDGFAGRWTLQLSGKMGGQRITGGQIEIDIRPDGTGTWTSWHRLYSKAGGAIITSDHTGSGTAQFDTTTRMLTSLQKYHRTKVKSYVPSMRHTSTSEEEGELNFKTIDKVQSARCR